MILLISELIFHEVPELILVYFYQTRYKPASFDLRLAAMIQPAIDFALAVLNIVSLSLATYHFQKVFPDGRQRIIASIVVLPCILLTPTLKVIIIYSTVLNQLVTLTTGGTFDPKKTRLIGFNGSIMITEKKPNDYEQDINQWIENSPYKDMFRPRASDCVSTLLNVNDQTITVVSDPTPFDETCINRFELAILSLAPCFIVIVLSLFYFVRKVWPYLDISYTCCGMCPLTDDLNITTSSKRRRSIKSLKLTSPTPFEDDNNILSQFYMEPSNTELAESISESGNSSSSHTSLSSLNSFNKNLILRMFTRAK